LTADLDRDLAMVADRFGDLVTLDHDSLKITDEARPLTRIIASAFDAHRPDGVRYSQAS
jgi:oxygen-independent coproporphyrinogen-3 oxidase